METVSVKFLAFGVAVAIVYNLLRPVAWRQGVLLVANVYFLSTFSSNPRAFLPFAVFMLFGFAGVRLMQDGHTKAFTPVLLAAIGSFIWLKKYTFLPHQSFLHFAYITLGLSYVFFRVLHLMIDGKNERLPHKVSLVSYLTYTLNFTTLVSGPIQLYPGFAETHLAPERPPLTIFTIGNAMERIAIGFFKVQVLSMLLSRIQGHAIATLSSTQSFPGRVATGAVIAASYPVYLYCNFSGYMDFVIGIAAFMRFKLPENFNRPFSADSFLDFWGRWHITLSGWFRTYFYNPLLTGLMRRFPDRTKAPILGVVAFFITFTLLGIWHGQNSVFVFYGLLLGFGVSVNKLYQIRMIKALGIKRYNTIASHPTYEAWARGLTYTYNAFCLFWFWSNWKQMGGFVATMKVPALLAAWALILVAATAVLAFWTVARERLLSIKWHGDPFLQNRYARTALATAVVVVVAAVMSLLIGPPAQIVYKAF